MRIIFPFCSYNEVLVKSGLTKLSDLRQEVVDKLFTEVLLKELNKLHKLLPARNTCTLNLRNMRKFKPVFLKRRTGFVIVLNRYYTLLYLFRTYSVPIRCFKLLVVFLLQLSIFNFLQNF